MKRILIVIALFLTSSNIFSQNPREDLSLGFSTTLGGPTAILSVSLDYFIMPTLNIEGGIGLFGYYGGAKYHFFGNTNSNVTPYIGRFLVGLRAFDLTNGKTHGVFYLPIGAQYISNRGFKIGLEAATFVVPKRLNEFINPDFEFGFGFRVWPALKIGFHF
jgi:hypothetical protein